MLLEENVGLKRGASIYIYVFTVVVVAKIKPIKLTANTNLLYVYVGLKTHWINIALRIIMNLAKYKVCVWEFYPNLFFFIRIFNEKKKT